MANLCQLNDVKSWLSIKATETSEDSLLSRLIASVSADFLTVIGRPDLVPAVDYTEIRAGNGLTTMRLRHWPINTVSSVTIDGRCMDASVDGIENGYWFDPTENPEDRFEILLINSVFTSTGGRGLDAFSFPLIGSGSRWTIPPNIVIEYNAGYPSGVVANELVNIPATPFKITVAQATDFESDTSVIFSVGGAALVKVSSSPAAGQYSVDVLGTYTFNSADTGKGVYISYKTLGTPSEVRQAVIDWTAYRYKQRQWIGQVSKQLMSTQGETTVFQNILMPATTAAVAEAYRRNLLVASHD